MFKYWAYRIAAAVSQAVPEKLAYWIGLRVADQYYRHNHAGREAVFSNLRQIFKGLAVEPAEAVLEGFARKTFQHFGKYLVDFFRYAMLTPQQLNRLVSRQHVDYLAQSLAPGRGVLMVTAHLGNWELGGAVVRAMGHKFNVVALPQQMEKLNRFFQEFRERRGFNVLLLGNSAFGIVRCLKRGEIVALLADRDFTARDDRTVFFGKETRMPRGPAYLSKMTGAPVLPGFLIRQVDDTYLLRFHPPIFPDQEASEEAIHQKMVRILEQEIGDQPFQWFLFDDFWKNDEHTSAHKGQEPG
ncbi:MAG: lysophospholipid acyltransferase family protein [Lentisphaerota bacterium]